jgi:hypothetical protein
MTRFRLPLIALSLLISSNAWADLKVYDVDPQYRQEIFAALQRILNPQGQPTNGRVELLPSGQLLVNASPDTLASVDLVLQTIRNSPAAAATPRANLNYWAVFGNRSAVANPPGTAPPSSLGDVLGELERLHGDLQFRVIGSAALATESGQQGQVSGMALEVEQTVFVQGDALNAAIDMTLEGRVAVPPAEFGFGGATVLPPVPEGVEFDIGSITVRTALRRGEFVVLGQSEVTGGGLDGPVFFIVHWPDNK